MPGGRPKALNLVDADYKVIEALSAHGMTIDRLAAYFKVSKRTFEKELEENELLKETIDHARARAVAQVEQILWEQVTKERIPQMIRFYLQCRGGWKPESTMQVSGGSGFTFKKKNA